MKLFACAVLAAVTIGQQVVVTDAETSEGFLQLEENSAADPIITQLTYKFLEDESYEGYINSFYSCDFGWNSCFSAANPIV